MNMRYQALVRTIVVYFGTGILFLLMCSNLNAAPAFMGLGDLPGGAFESSADYISPDGGTVLGVSRTGLGFRSFLWTEPGGMQALSLFPSGDFTSGSSFAITNDHSVIVGVGQSSNGTEGFRWNLGAGASGLGDLPGGVFRSIPATMSSDGSVIVGKGTIGPDTSDNIEAFIWTEANGMIGLGDLPGGKTRSEATDISADGSVVVGVGMDEVFVSGNPEPIDRSRLFRWTQADGMVALDIPPLHSASILDTRISADGSVITANTIDGLGETHPFRWTQSTGIVFLDEPVGGEHLSRVVALSSDGSSMAGWAFTDDGPQAVVWDDLHGPRFLSDVLTTLGLDLTGWSLEFTTGISDDGLTIVGTGINPDGNTEAFIARLPEPGAFALVAVGMVVLVRRQRA